MIGQQKSQDKTKTVATKVPEWVADLLNIICKARGTDIYGLLKLVLEFIVETAKVSGPVPPAMQTILHMLKMDVDWNNAFAFSDPTAQLDVAQVILVLQQSKDGKPRQGFGLAMIDKPFLPGETPKVTLCVDDILERVAEVSMKGLYRELRQIGVALEFDSLRETLTHLCNGAIIDHLNAMDSEELPQVGNFSDFGKQIEYGKRTRQTKRKSPDDIHQQQKIVFGEIERNIADYEAEEWEGERRNHESTLPPEPIGW